MKFEMLGRIFSAMVLIVCFSAPAFAAQNEGVVVWRLEGKEGVSEKNVDLISGFLSTEVERISGRKVISEGDIRTIIKGEETRQQCGTVDTGCIAEVGNALGVPEAVSGELGRLGRIWMLNLRRINVRQAETIKRTSLQIDGSIEDVVKALPSGVSKLFDTEEPQAAGIAEPESEPELPGTLSIESEPTGAAIHVDGELAGDAPLKQELVPGSYNIKAMMEGYKTQKETVEILSDQQSDLMLVLEKDYPMNPYTKYGHVAFWTGLGLAAFGGVATWQAKEAADAYATGNWARKDLNEIWSGLAITGFILGGAGMITGTTLWILSPGDKAWAERNSVSVGPTSNGQGAMAQFSGRW